MAKRVVTIPASAKDDPFYRYKRERIEIQPLESGTVTMIQNTHKIIPSLMRKFEKEMLPRHQKMLAKHLAKDVGVASFFRHDCICLRGSLSVESIEASLEKFIAKYYLCRRCGKPELNQERKCEACGGH